MEIAASSFFVLTLRPRVATEAVLTTRQTRLYQFVAGRPSASKEDAARFLSVSADTTLRELRVLVEAGLVVREGIGKATVYRVSGGRPGS
jgi:predicted ArsR family transcriptional regulator